MCYVYIYAYITLYYIVIYILYIYIYSIQVFAFDYLCFNFAYVQFIQVWRLGHQRFEAVTARASSLCPRLHSSRGHPTLSWRAATNHLPVIRSIFMCFDCQSLTYEEQSQQASAGMGRASIGKRAQGWQFSAQFNLASVCHIQGIQVIKRRWYKSYQWKGRLKQQILWSNTCKSEVLAFLSCKHTSVEERKRNAFWK